MFWLGLGLGLILNLRSAQNRFMPANMISTDLMTSAFSTNLGDASHPRLFRSNICFHFECYFP